MSNSRLAAAGSNKPYENQLIESNLGLVFHIAHRYRTTHFALDELVSVGYVGLVKAARTYRTDRNVLFSTYAGRCITNEILMFLRQNIKHLKVLSLDAPMQNGDKESASTITDLLGTLDDRIEKGIEHEEEQSALLNAVSRLSQRNRALISMRYGLCGQKKLGQAEIAAALGISQSYVSRLEKHCIHCLRKMLA